MNKEQYEIIKQGAKVWNRWRSDNPWVQVDLSRAYLRYINLSNANLSNANLCYIDLRDANLRDAMLHNTILNMADLWGTELTKANLSNTDLSNANLSIANLSNADLKGANLKSTNLESANLESTNLRYTNLENTSFMYTNFNNTTISFTDLSRCRGLENVFHVDQSVIDIKSVKFNYKKLPKKFLSGCGFKKWQIEAMKLNDSTLTSAEIVDILYSISDLRNNIPTQPYKLFISYSKKDELFVNTLEAVFNDKEIKYWRDVHYLVAGPLEKQIERAISTNKIVLLILSKNSFDSDWMEFEVRHARKIEKAMKRHVLCPIALDDSWKDCNWPKRIMAQIKEYNIIDFSDWQNEEFFQKQFSKLLEGLNIYYRDENP